MKDEYAIDIVEMGLGDVEVSVCGWEHEGVDVKEKVGVMFGPCEPGPIDREIKGTVGKTVKEVGGKLVIIFHDSRSIDVVINALQEAKKEMLGGKVNG